MGLPENLRRLREDHGFPSQNSLAEASGVPVSLINRIERGQRKRTAYETILKLANALKVTVEELTGDSPAVDDDPELREHMGQANAEYLTPAELAIYKRHFYEARVLRRRAEARKLAEQRPPYQGESRGVGT